LALGEDQKAVVNNTLKVIVDELKEARGNSNSRLDVVVPGLGSIAVRVLLPRQQSRSSQLCSFSILSNARFLPVSPPFSTTSLHVFSPCFLSPFLSEYGIFVIGELETSVCGECYSCGRLGDG
jgi:hypothetical protein